MQLPATLHVLERGWLSSNSIVFLEGDEASVVDTGYFTHTTQTIRLIEQTIGPRRLTRIINTHLHSDHAGGNARLRQLHGARVIIPPGMAAAVQMWDVTTLGYLACGQHCPRFSFDETLRLDQPLRLGGMDWEVISAPGHDADMVLLFNHDEGVLISADALWENGFGAIFPDVEGEPGFDEQRQTLARIERCGARTVIPGHGAPFTGVERAIERARARLDALAASPERNARNVVKVLMKFWLLQARETTLDRLTSHFETARYFYVVHRQYFSEVTFAAMIETCVLELVRGGSVKITGDVISNAD